MQIGPRVKECESRQREYPRFHQTGCTKRVTFMYKIITLRERLKGLDNKERTDRQPLSDSGSDSRNTLTYFSEPYTLKTEGRLFFWEVWNRTPSGKASYPTRNESSTISL